jgi:hypothetical protein
MRKLVMGIALATLLLPAAPSFAQVGVEVGPGGIGVGVGRDRDYRDRDYRDREYRRDRVYEERRGYRERDRFERGRSCRTIIDRERTPSGRVIVRRTRVC